MNVLVALFLAGATPAAINRIPEFGAENCSAKPLTHLIGRAATKSRVAWALKKSGAKAVRKFRSGEAVTLDYRTDRLNIQTDRRNIIRKVNCG